jgi:hypothetical protein
MTTSGLRPPDASGMQAFNPLLLAVAGIYLAWSWIHLPTSIWFRFIFACVLIWRMKPDIIIPYMLSCLQLSLNFSGRSVFSDMEAAQVERFSQALTGYESYAFAIPCVLFAVRTFLEAVNASNTRRVAFPWMLYGLYLFGSIFVILGALYTAGTNGWTTGLRMYCMVGLYFYGLLMPACSPKELTKIACAMLVGGSVMCVTAVLAPFHTRQLFVLLPFCPAAIPWIPSLPLTASTSGLAAIPATLVFIKNSTFTMAMISIWSGLVGFLMWISGRRRRRRRVVIFSATISALLVSVAFVGYAAAFHDPGKRDTHNEDTQYERLKFKLTGDRGPIWFGVMRDLVVRPNILAISNRTIPIVTHGEEVDWPFSAHNIFL